MAKLELDQVSKHYGPVRAVDAVSLTVEEGQTIVLLGPSGCGKTTLLRMIAGFFRPDGGTIRIGKRIAASSSVMVPPEKRSLSMVFQSYAVWPHKTVFENIAYGLRLKKLQGSALRRKVEEALSLVRMEAYASQYPGELSGGQQQRVALARAVALEPEILLFDEPLSNLDASLREHMRFEIKSLLTRLKITGVYVTHDQNEAMVVGDRIAVMNAGRIEQVGTAEEIYYGSNTEFVARFVGLANVYDAEILGEAGENLVRVQTKGIGEVVARAPIPAGRGQPVRLFVRPEGVSFENRVEPALNRYIGRVTQRTFLGSHVDYVVDVNGVPIRAISSAEGAPSQIGEETAICLSPTRCLVLASNA